MTTINPKFTTAYYEPSKKCLCVCGSGLKFKRCCAGNYSSKGLKGFQNSYNSGNYKQALNHARNHFTWYALSHKAHTENFLKADRKAAENLLQLDINALAELLDNLYRCYHQLDQGHKFIAVIKKSSDLIQDPRWDAKIAYALGIWYLIEKDDANASFTSLKSLDISTCNDPDVLSLYLQVNPLRLSLTETFGLIDRIVLNTVKESVKLQYRVLKAVKYYLVCQKADAETEIKNALDSFSNLSIEKKSAYGRFQYAKALEIYGRASGKDNILTEGRDAVLNLIHEAEKCAYTAEYISELNKLLGDFEESMGNHLAAINAYSKSPSHLTNVFLAQAISNNGENDKAREVLEAIDSNELDDAGKFDLALSWATIAMTSLSAKDLEKAKSQLQDIKTHDPLFIQLRDSRLISLLEIKPKSESGKIRKLICSWNKYIILNPNFFGVGININRIIEDADSSIQNDKG